MKRILIMLSMLLTLTVSAAGASGAGVASGHGSAGGKDAVAAGSRDDGKKHLRHVPGKLVVKLKPGMAPDALEPFTRKHHGTFSEKKVGHQSHARFRDLYVIAVPEDADLEALAAELRQDEAVEYAEPLVVYHAQLVPNDPLYVQQWSHKNTQAEAGWNVTTGSPSTVIAVVDTGVAWSHPDLAPNIWSDGQGNHGRDFVDIDTAAYVASGYQLISGEDYVTVDGDPADYFGHGTHVAGIAAATGNNGIGVSGVCPGCRIMAVRAGFAMRQGGYDYGMFQSDTIADAITFAADNGARIINMSFGGGPSQLMQDAIDYAFSKGVVLVAAAGNSATADTDSAYPAAYGNVIAVAATGKSDARAYYSNYGAWVTVAAPGGDGASPILSTVPATGTISSATGYLSISGTSMAAPYISGVAGLILSKNPNLNNRQVRQIIRQGVDVYNVDLPDSATYLGTGRTNVGKTLQINSASGATTSITAPANDFLTGGSITVSGSSSAPYSVSAGQGIYPTAWSQLASGQAMSGLLASFDSSTLGAVLDDYTIKVVAQDAYGRTDSIVQGRIGTRFLPGWPQQYSSSSFPAAVSNTPTLADVNGDGFDEIIITGQDSSGRGMITVLQKDGTPAEGKWPQSVSSSTSEFPYGAVAGDLNGDGEIEIVAPYTANLVSTLNCWDQYGNLLWSKVLEPDNSLGNVTLADINGDGKLEIITRTLSSKLYALDAGGNVLWSYNLNEYDAIDQAKNVAVADFDGDGRKEIAANVIVNSNPGNTGYENRTWGGALLLFNSDGTVRWRHNWPEPGESLPAYYDIHPVVSPLLADVNRDGRTEIVARVRVWKADATGTKEASTRVYVFDDRGGVLPGFPITVSGYPSNSEMALGDLDQDGYPEIVAGTADVAVDGVSGTPDAVHGSLHAITHTGSLLFPSPKYPVASNPTIADVTGDGKPDILFYDGTVFRIVQRDGSVSTLQVKVRDPYSNLHNTPVVTDLDRDGTEELIYLEGQGPAFLWAWDLQVPHVAEAEHFTRPGFDAQHSNHYVMPGATPGQLPAGWSTADVGSVGIAGKASFANGVFTLQGAGTNIWGTADAFRYAYKTLNGDGQIIARVTSVQNTNGYAKGGVMIRQSLAADSAYAMVDLTPSYGAEFSRRLAAGGTTTVNATAGISVPYWVKLVRQGSSLSAYTGNDGINWTLLGNSSINIGSAIYIGLIANSHNNTVLCSTTFDSVAISAPATPPTVAISAPAAGASYPAPANVVISADATPGTGAANVSKVDFYAGSTLVGSATAAPYNVTWSNVAAGSYTLTAKVTDSLGGTATSAPVAITVVATALPAPWASQDIGSVRAVGSAAYLNGTFTVKGSGADIYGSADAFRFVYQPMSGDGQIVARVVSVQNTSTYAKGGVMIRQSLTANSVHAMMDLTPATGAEFSRRTSAGGSTTVSVKSGIPAPYWVKLVRSGNSFTGAVSSDGVNWLRVGSASIAMTGTVYVGLIVNSHNNAVLCTGTFEKVAVTVGAADITPPTVTAFSIPSTSSSLTVPISTFTATDGSGSGVSGYLVTESSSKPSASATGWSATPPGSYTFATSGTKTLYAWAKDAAGNVSNSRSATVAVSIGGLPSPWLTQDIGSVGVIGSAGYANGVFTVKGSGADIWGSVDAFRFVYKTMSGDGQIIARVGSVQNTNSYAKGGVMMRQSLTANSMYAMMDLRPTGGAEFSRRTATGGSSTATTRTGLTAPYWVRLVRSGNTFTGYVSPDGVVWSQVGSATIGMSSTIYVGLIVNSHSNSVLCTTTIDNVR